MSERRGTTDHDPVLTGGGSSPMWDRKLSAVGKLWISLDQFDATKL